MSIEAYQIGVSFVADATKVSGPIGEMLRGMDRILERQKDVNMGFVSMVSSLGGARRLAGGLASDLERAAKAARDVASASGRFRPASAASGGAFGGGEHTSTSRSSSRTSAAEMAAAATAAAQQTNAHGQLLLPAPDLRLAYDPSANMRTSTAGIPGNGILGGPGIPVGSPYGPPPPTRPQRVLAIIPGVGVTEEGIEDEPFFEGSEPRESRWSKMRRGARTAVKAAQTGSMTGLRALGNMRVPHKHHALTLPEVFAGYLGWHVLSSGFEQAGAYDQTFLSMSGDPKVNIAALRTQADRIRRTNPYINAPDSATLVSEAYDLSGGRMGEVPAIADILSRVDRSFQLLGKDGPAALRESANFVRAQDISNRFYNPATGQFDAERANASTDAAMGMIFANRQFMQGKNFFQFSRSAGAAAQQMSDTGMFNLAHFIDIAPAKAGMQVRSLENLFGGFHPRMKNADFEYFQSLGLVGRNGQFKGQQELYSDPIGWIMQNIVPLLPRHPELLGMIQRMNVSDLINETYGASGNVARQAAAARRTTATASVNALEGGSKAAQQRTEIAWERFEFSLGQFAQGPGIKVLNSLTDALNNTSAYMAAHPNDMSRLATQAGDFAKGMVGAATLMSKAIAIVPAWLWPTLLGAAGGARVGGLWGAAAGATVGASYSLSHGALNLDRKYGYDNPNYHLTWKDKLDPFQLFHTPEKADAGQPIQVNLQIGGQQLASVLVPHIEAKMSSNARKESRASNGMYDSWAGVTLPGISGGR
ncbi:hypothetical protein [Gluconobacter japonicus]|uniref:hypothetical protein n=1 Tax=Gluconobacter japonicus TaxID=376620 RepID=UPI001B8D74F0|nr:hypothetical protein [Gluconobacter japonicus]MBS1050472.1 hypothetical protein [Gluconobacter japonicus]